MNNIIAMTFIGWEIGGCLIIVLLLILIRIITQSRVREKCPHCGGHKMISTRGEFVEDAPNNKHWNETMGWPTTIHTCKKCGKVASQEIGLYRSKNETD